MSTCHGHMFRCLMFSCLIFVGLSCSMILWLGIVPLDIFSAGLSLPLPHPDHVGVELVVDTAWLWTFYFDDNTESAPQSPRCSDSHPGCVHESEVKTKKVFSLKYSIIFQRCLQSLLHCLHFLYNFAKKYVIQ